MSPVFETGKVDERFEVLVAVKIQVEVSLLVLVALAVRHFPSRFLLASGLCRPPALEAYAYALFSLRQSLRTKSRKCGCSKT